MKFKPEVNMDEGSKTKRLLLGPMIIKDAWLLQATTKGCTVQESSVE
jgi:hypothetical protein